MKVKMYYIDLRCFAALSEGGVCDFTGSHRYEIFEGDTVESLLDRLWMPKEEIKIIFLNNKLVDFDEVLHDGDQLGLAPPVSGM
ncbi:MAG: MoaD/ThiS family protein [Syntrophobacteria bacterium]|jgi:molybdopterin converting factor small subunit